MANRESAIAEIDKSLAMVRERLISHVDRKRGGVVEVRFPFRGGGLREVVFSEEYRVGDDTKTQQ